MSKLSSTNGNGSLAVESGFLQRFVTRKRLTVLSTVGTQFAIFALHAVHSIILARMLGPAGRGEYGTVMFYSQTLLYAGMFGATFVIARRALTDDVANGRLARAALAVGLITGAVSFLMAWLGGRFGLPADRQNLLPYCLAVALMLPLEHMRLALLAVDHGANNFRRYNWNRLLAAFLFPVLLIALWGIGHASLQAVVAAVLLSAFLSLASLVVSYGGTMIGSRASVKVFPLLHESIPYGISYVAGQLLARVDILLAIWLMTLADQGLYAVAMAMVGLMQLVPNSIAIFSFNAGANRDQSNSSSVIGRYVQLVLAAQLASAAGFAIIMPYLVPFAFGDKFANATRMALILLPGIAIEGLGSVAESYARGMGYPLSTLWPKFIAAIMLVVIALVLHAAYPTLAVPIAASIAFFVHGVLTCILVSRLSASVPAKGKPS
jgi:O-antigen/teichoic acid export membrane protein